MAGYDFEFKINNRHFSLAFDFLRYMKAFYELYGLELQFILTRKRRLVIYVTVDGDLAVMQILSIKIREKEEAKKCSSKSNCSFLQIELRRSKENHRRNI